MSDPTDAEVLARLDAIAAALVERAAPVAIRMAESPAEVVVAQLLRGAAVVRRGWADEATLVDGRDVDADDARAVHLLAFRGERAVGTCRLLFPVSGHAAEPVFLGRLAVADPDSRSERTVTAGLIGRGWLEVRSRRYSRISGLTSAGMLRLLRRMGFAVRVVGAPVRFAGEERVPIVFGPSEGSAASPSKR